MEQKTYRILCVGTHQTPSNAYRRALRFRAIGHEVATFNTSTFGLVRWQRLRNGLVKIMGRCLPAVLKRKLIKQIQDFQPDVVFFEKCQWLAPQDFVSVREAGPERMILAHYNPDEFFGEHSPKRWGTFVESIPCYDIHFVPKPLNEPDYTKRGAKRVVVYDRSYDPSLHRPVELSGEEKEQYECEVGFIGKWAPHRERVLAELVQEGVPLVIWGNGWQRGQHWEMLRNVWRGPGQYNEDYTRAICGMKIALHFLRRENRDEQDSRSFEIPACGVFMLAERTPAHQRLFDEGKEAVFFDDTEELLEQVNYYLNHPKERDMIAEAGRRRSLSSPYSHDDRLQEFLWVMSSQER
jgi:hypothetical protein